MMTRLTLVVLLLAMPVIASAQVADIHRGKVRILSTAADALCVGSSGGASPTCTGGLQAASIAGATFTGANTFTGAGNLFQSGAVTWPTSILGQVAGRIALTSNISGDAIIDLHVDRTIVTGMSAGQVYFTGRVNDTGPVYAIYAVVDAAKVNNTQGNQLADLRLYVNTGSGVVNTATLTSTSQFEVASGTSALPSYSFLNDPDTGWYSFGANQVSLTTGGVELIRINSGKVDLQSQALGVGNVAGQIVQIGSNTSGAGAAGALTLLDKTGAKNVVWSDTTGTLRIGTAAPEEDGAPSDTSGTVVGTQTSTRDTKDLLGAFTDYHGALDALLRVPLHRFTYRSGAYGGTVFTGVLGDELPAVMMDADSAHPEGRSFSPVSAFGYTVAAVKALQAEIDALRNPYARLFQ